MSMLSTAQNAPTVRKRYVEFDVLRTISMFLMVIAHTWECFMDYMDSSIWYHYDLFAHVYPVIGPSVLMMCLGTNFSFASKKSPKELALRGVKFILIDFLLNILRYGVPAVFVTLSGKPEEIGFFLENVFASDIYAFVGAMHILFAFFQKLDLSVFQMSLVSILMMTLNSLLDYFDINTFDSPYLSAFLGRFIWTGYTSYFSLLSWFLFPVIGFGFGRYYKNLSEGKKGLLARNLFLGCSCGFLGLSSALLVNGLHPNISVIALHGWKNDFIRTMLMIFLGGISFSFACALVRRFSASRFVAGCAKISRIIMPFYIIQWILIAWTDRMLYALDAYNIIHSIGTVYLLAALFILLSLFLTFGFTRLQTKRRSSKK